MRRLPSARRFNVHEYHRMAAAGILTEDDPVELIEGEIVEMPPMGSTHAACIVRLNRHLVPQVGSQMDVRVQLPVRLDEHSEPEPDVALVRRRADSYDTAHPGPDDVLLVIEVAETTIRFDRSVKAAVYARAAIPEYWLIDLRRQQVEVSREPDGGRYRTVQVFRRGERLRLASVPQVDLPVDAILGD
jgi:Uma2 family endonuclease